MSDIDEKIKEALQGVDDSEELFADPKLLMEAIVPFRGRRKWVNVLGLIYGVLGVTLAVWASVKFYHADVIREQLMWGGLAFLGILCNAFIKVFFWMEMHTNRLMRELKRVELLVLQLKK